MPLTTQQAPHLAAPPDRGSAGFVYLVSAVAALGGLLFGFDTAVVSGAIGLMKAQFALNDAQTGFTASSALLGCAFGAAMAGVLADRFGRRRILILSAIFFLVSAIGTAIPRTIPEFNIMRVVGGLGVGIASMLSPLYIAEVAPARIRGRLVSLNQMAIITGILAAYMTNFLCDRWLPDHLAWRWMFGSESLPAVFFWVAMAMAPESPRWLIKQGRAEEGLAILTRVGGRVHAASEMREIQDAVSHEGGSLADLFNPGLRIALLIGVALAIFQQITGINTILYYAPEIFKSAGFDTSNALLFSVYVGLINGLFTVFAILLVDRLGRRPLLLLGAAGMGVSLALVARAFQTKMTGGAVALFVLAYVASFALTLGPVVWVVISEIFPTKVRGRAMSIATVTLWVACYVVSQTFPMLVERIKEPATFYMYSVICFIMIAFVAAVVPETKGKTLEEIERRFMK